MINQKVQDALNDQIKHELYSSYVYLAVSAYCQTISLPGFANWFLLQSGEEKDHAMKIYNFILDRGGKVKLQAIDSPPSEYGTTLQIAQKALEHEQKVTGLIDQITMVGDNRAALLMMDMELGKRVA